MRHPVSTSRRLKGHEGLGGSVTGDVVRPAVLPAAPEDAHPGAGEDPDGVRVITAAGPGARIDGSGPPRGMARVVGEGGEGLTQALMARPAEGDAAVLARGVGDGCHAAFASEVLRRGEAAAVVAEFSEDLRGIDLTAPGEALEDGPVGVLVQARRDGGGELLDLGDEGGEHRHQGEDEFATGLALRVAGAIARG